MCRAGPAAVSGLSDCSSSWAAVPRAAESGRLGRKPVCGLAGEPEDQAEQNFKLKAILIGGGALSESLAAAARGSSAAIMLPEQGSTVTVSRTATMCSSGH